MKIDMATEFNPFSELKVSMSLSMAYAEKFLLKSF